MTLTRSARLLAVAAAAALVLAACGSDDGATTTTEPEQATTTTEAPTVATTAVATTTGAGQPATLEELGVQVCSGAGGFPGNAAYEAGAADPTPIAMFWTFTDAGTTRPILSEMTGSQVDDEEPYGDNAEAVTAQLVGCIAETGRTDRGIDCEIPKSDGGSNTSRLFDGHYDLTVRVAQTGEVLQTIELVGTSAGCDDADLAFYTGADLVNPPADADITAALASVVGA